jgi:hypothetical protein
MVLRFFEQDFLVSEYCHPTRNLYYVAGYRFLFVWKLGHVEKLDEGYRRNCAIGVDPDTLHAANTRNHSFFPDHFARETLSKKKNQASGTPLRSLWIIPLALT